MPWEATRITVVPEDWHILSWTSDTIGVGGNAYANTKLSQSSDRAFNPKSPLPGKAKKKWNQSVLRFCKQPYGVLTAMQRIVCLEPDDPTLGQYIDEQSHVQGRG